MEHLLQVATVNAVQQCSATAIYVLFVVYYVVSENYFSAPIKRGRIMNEVTRNDASQSLSNSDAIGLATEIISAYVSKNPVQSTELSSLIREIHGTLISLDSAGTSSAAQKPAVPVKKSITDEFLICLEDGKKFKSLKRHLRSKYDMTPAEYREKWGLPYDYPMVAPSYAKRRSQLAKEMGLGKGAK